MTKSIFFVFVLFLPTIVFSASGDFGGTGLENPIEADSIEELVATILDILVLIGTPIVIFFLIYAGFLFVTARGNVTKIDTAKQAFLWTLIGGLVILGAKVIAEIIKSTIDQIAG